jgi:hypothetical protein
MSGTNTLEVYNADVLAGENDVIVAAMNYRVGAFGFLYMGIEDAPGESYARIFGRKLLFIREVLWYIFICLTKLNLVKVKGCERFTAMYVFTYITSIITQWDTSLPIQNLDRALHIHLLLKTGHRIRILSKMVKFRSQFRYDILG